MIEITESKYRATNVGNGVFVGLRKGGIIEMYCAVPERQKMDEPFVRFKIKM